MLPPLVDREIQSAADLSVFAGFNCGDELWSRAASQWITGPLAIASMARGTTIIQYSIGHGGATVGFGSIGTTKWRLPPPSGEWTPLAIIPMFASLRLFSTRHRDAKIPPRDIADKCCKTW